MNANEEFILIKYIISNRKGLSIELKAEHRKDGLVVFYAAGLQAGLQPANEGDPINQGRYPGLVCKSPLGLGHN